MITDRNKQILVLNGKSYSLDLLLQRVETECGEKKIFLQELYEFLYQWFDHSETLTINTSGSTGIPKPIIVSKQRMIESAKLTCSFLKLQPNDTALLCMPLKYIAGKMMVVRALVAQLDLYCETPSGNPLRRVDYPIQFAAMVPAQVYNILDDEESNVKLSTIKNLIIGGGSISKELEEKLQYQRGNIYSTYGMTETLSHIALRKLNEPNRQEYYQPFPSVELSLAEDSTLIIDAPLVCDEIVKTNDIAKILDDRCFYILGRKDNIINSGGVKIQIEELEKGIAKFITHPFAITSVPPSKWGEEIVLLIENTNNECDCNLEIEALPKYSRPHHIYYVSQLPLTETCKINRAACKELAIEAKKRTT